MKIFLLLLALIPYYNNSVHQVSWYGSKFHGKVTASGDVYDMNQYTCAATRDFNFGDSLKVTNIKNQKHVIVVVNDRGRFRQLGRTLDLSRAAFKEIANLDRGVIRVTIEKLN